MVVAVSSKVTLSSAEQLFLELTNAARLNPQAEADRLLGGDLNEGVAAYNLATQRNYDLSDVGPMQVLAPNKALSDASLAHSLWMLDVDEFSHAGDPSLRNHPDYPGTPSYPANSNAGERMAAAGYDFSGSWAWGENIAWLGTTGVLDPDAAVVSHYVGLFESVGHRLNTLSTDFYEAGIGQHVGAFTADDGVNYTSTSMLTHKFAKSGGSVFISGVAFSDLNGDGAYGIGEGTGGIGYSAGAVADTSSTSGGYILELSAAASAAVTITTPQDTFDVTIDLSRGSVKLDLVDGAVLQSSADLVLGTGAISARLLGGADLRLTGNDADNFLFGGQGDDTITGGMGTDTVVYQGQQSDYTISDTAGTLTVTHSDGSAAGDGTDQLIEIEVIQFADAQWVYRPQTGEVLTDPPLDPLHLSGHVHSPDGDAIPDLALRLHMNDGESVIYGADSGADGSFDLAHGAGAGVLRASTLATSSRNDITVLDALNVLRIAVGLDPASGPADDFQYIAADTTQDGRISVADALDVLRFSVGLDSEGAGSYVLLDGPVGTQSQNSVVYDDDIEIAGTSDANLDITALRLGDLDFA